MSTRLLDALADKHRELSEIRPSQMAKANLRKPEMPWRERVGRAFARAAAPWSLKELSEMLDRDERQIARWKTGGERAPFDVLLACDPLRPRLIVELAKLDEEIVVETVVRMRTA